MNRWCPHSIPWKTQHLNLIPSTSEQRLIFTNWAAKNGCAEHCWVNASKNILLDWCPSPKLQWMPDSTGPASVLVIPSVCGSGRGESCSVEDTRIGRTWLKFALDLKSMLSLVAGGPDSKFRQAKQDLRVTNNAWYLRAMPIDDSRQTSAAIAYLSIGRLS